MQQPPADRRATYLAALTLEIEKKLRKALSSPGQRPDLLQQLFADTALEIEDEARDIIFNKDEDQITITDNRTESSLCFYDVLADYYVRAPENGKQILDLIVQLWSQSFVSHIFALLFHKWLFEVSVENTEVLLRYGSALVQGATNIFWIDIQTNRRRFLSLFSYLLEEVALVTVHTNKISLQAHRDLYLLLSRFLFFYNLDALLENFIKHFPAFPNAFLVGGPADIFVIEVTDQLQKLKVEPVLLHYLSRMSTLQGYAFFSRRSRSLGAAACVNFLHLDGFCGNCLCRARIEDEYKYKAKGMPVQLHFSRGTHVSNKSCTSCSPEYTGSALPSWSISSSRYKPLLSAALPVVLAFIVLELC